MPSDMITSLTHPTPEVSSSRLQSDAEVLPSASSPTSLRKSSRVAKRASSALALAPPARKTRRKMDSYASAIGERILWSAKTKQKTHRQEWIPRYEVELGLRPGSAMPQGRITDAICKFCTAFGREGNNCKEVSPFAELLNSPKSKKSARAKVFTFFRCDNIVVHMHEQHPQRWLEFSALPLNLSKRAEFFALSKTIMTFLPALPSFQFRVPAGVFSTIKQMFCVTGEDSIMIDGFIELEDGDCSTLQPPMLDPPT